MFQANVNPRALYPELKELTAAATSARELMNSIAGLLHKNLLMYNWVGFYMIEKEAGGQRIYDATYSHQTESGYLRRGSVYWQDNHR
jgi:hypothetical protein